MISGEGVRTWANPAYMLETISCFRLSKNFRASFLAQSMGKLKFLPIFVMNIDYKVFVTKIGKHLRFPIDCTKKLALKFLLDLKPGMVSNI